MINEQLRKDLLKKHTKYERARIIAARALQLELNAPFLMNFDKETLEKINYDPVRIAEIEFKHNLIPMRVRRI